MRNVLAVAGFLSLSVITGLQGQEGLEKSLELAARWAADSVSPLARAWLRIALRVHGVKTPEAQPAALPLDLQLIALEALAAPEGNHRFFKTEGAA